VNATIADFAPTFRLQVLRIDQRPHTTHQTFAIRSLAKTV
jgi:hypothetical protein